MRTVDSRVADDGTELRLKRKRNGTFIVTEAGSNQRTGEVARTREEGQRQLDETVRLYGQASQSGSRSRSGGGFEQGLGGGLGGYDDGGFFGGGGQDQDEQDSLLFGDAFGEPRQDDDDNSGQSIIDAFEEFFGGGKR